MNEFAGATWLFVPGHRPDRFDKALATGADEVILDWRTLSRPSENPKLETPSRNGYAAEGTAGSESTPAATGWAPTWTR
jgi:citrate lyase subunit beta/citryl-CoA lyase